MDFTRLRTNELATSQRKKRCGEHKTTIHGERLARMYRLPFSSGLFLCYINWVFGPGYCDGGFGMLSLIARRNMIYNGLETSNQKVQMKSARGRCG
jgi:hypothetical protein